MAQCSTEFVRALDQYYHGALISLPKFFHYRKVQGWISYLREDANYITKEGGPEALSRDDLVRAAQERGFIGASSGTTLAICGLLNLNILQIIFTIAPSRATNSRAVSDGELQKWLEEWIRLANDVGDVKLLIFPLQSLEIEEES